MEDLREDIGIIQMDWYYMWTTRVVVSSVIVAICLHKVVMYFISGDQPKGDGDGKYKNKCTPKMSYKKQCTRVLIDIEKIQVF